MLAGDAGLAVQGIEDGGLLTVTAGVDDVPPRVYDDVVEAMADIVERDLEPWVPVAGRRTALTAASLLMALGAVALFLQASGFARAAAAAVALVLATGAIVVSRAQREAEAAVVMAWMGAPTPPSRASCSPRAGPCSACPWRTPALGRRSLAWSVSSGSGEGRTLMIPPLVVGALCLASWPGHPRCVPSTRPSSSPPR